MHNVEWCSVKANFVWIAAEFSKICLKSEREPECQNKSNPKYEIFVLAFFHITFLSRKNTFSALKPNCDDDDDNNNLLMRVNSIIIWFINWIVSCHL